VNLAGIVAVVAVLVTIGSVAAIRISRLSESNDELQRRLDERLRAGRSTDAGSDGEGE
jgi:hypothetical protein